MSNAEPTLQEMADRGETHALENRWLDIIDRPDLDRRQLLDVLATLVKRPALDTAQTLAWSWLASTREKADPADALDLGRELLLICGDNPDLRNDVLELYRIVHAGHPSLEPLLDAAGLAGAKSPRRALRTLDICLRLRPGDYLIDRSSDRAAQVVAIEPETAAFTLRIGQQVESFDPDALALAFDPVEPNDFRVLGQLHPDRLIELADSDPAALVIGVLQSRHGRIDSDHLEPLLCPRVIPADRWAAWWSRAKTALRRHPNVMVEGRNPIVLTYIPGGQSLEEEIEPQWLKADTPAQRLAVIETYFRETKARRLSPDPDRIRRFYDSLRQRVDTSRRGSPADALTEALIIERLAAGAPLPDNALSPASDILAESPDLPALLARLGEHRLYLHALDLIRQTLPDRWTDLYLQLLPSAPTEACDAIARALHDAGRTTDLRSVVGTLLADVGPHLDAVCWLWRGPAVPDLEPVDRRELLTRLLEYLGSLARKDGTHPEVLRRARTRIRAALSADDYRHFRRLIADMEPGMASTVHRTVDRLQGLGHVVHARLLRIIHDTHPQLFVRVKTDPWFDDNLIFCTAAGMQKQENDLNFLLNVKIPENAKAIGNAAAHGDLSENSEFKFALEERDLLRARVLHMQQDLARARLITANDVATDHVNVGTRVTLAPLEGGPEQVFTILGPWEADVDNRIFNYRAPVCARLKGLAVGDTVALDADGAERPYRVVAIDNALD